MLRPKPLGRPYTVKNPLLAKVTVNQELYKDKERSCKHIELSLAGTSVRSVSVARQDMQKQCYARPY